MERHRSRHEIDGGASPSLIIAAHSSEDRVLDELSRKMLSWSSLWFGSSEDKETTDAHRQIRERLLWWLKLCIGQKARGVLTSHGEDISLATSTPLLTALLGRRAVRELSRRVLNDL